MTSTLWGILYQRYALNRRKRTRLLGRLRRRTTPPPPPSPECSNTDTTWGPFTFRYVLCYCCHKRIEEGETVVVDSDGQRMMHYTCFEHLLADKWDLANLRRDAQKGQEEEP